MMLEIPLPESTLFPLGQLLATPGALAALGNDDAERIHNIDSLLQRHGRGDWGEVGEEDAETNRAALENGQRLLSVFTVGEQAIWLITEADRSATTLLLPSEY